MIKFLQMAQKCVFTVDLFKLIQNSCIEKKICVLSKVFLFMNKTEFCNNNIEKSSLCYL